MKVSKKLISIFLVVAMVMTVVVPISVSAETETEIYSDNFDSYADIAAALASGNWSTPLSGSVAITNGEVVLPANSGQCFNYTLPKKLETGLIEVEADIKTEAGSQILFELKPSDSDIGSIALAGPGWDSNRNVNNMFVQKTEGQAAYWLYTGEFGTWYHVTVTLDIASNKYDIKIENQTQASKLAEMKGLTSIIREDGKLNDLTSIQFRNWGTGAAYVDNFKISKIGEGTVPVDLKKGVFENFDSYTNLSDALAGGKWATTLSGSVAITNGEVVLPANSGQGLRYNLPYTLTSGIVEVEADIKTEAGAQALFELMPTESDIGVMALAGPGWDSNRNVNNMFVQKTEGQAAYWFYTGEFGTWYHVTVTLDVALKKYNIKVENQSQTETLAELKDLTAVIRTDGILNNLTAIQFRNWGTGATYIDNFKVREVVELYKGTLPVEENTGDMNRVPQNNPDEIVELAGSIWSQPFVLDMNKDGYLDLAVSGTGICDDGVYVFYGGPNSSEDLLMTEAYRVCDGKKNVYPTYLYDDEGNYENTILTANWATIHEDFANNLWNNGKSIAMDNVSWPYGPSLYEADEYSFVDYDGDGKLDLIRGCADWNEYGWECKYDSEGNWGDENGDPQHGYVMWAKNTGTNDAPVYANVAQAVCINGDTSKPVDVYGRPGPSFYDWDGDGDLDLVCGSFIGDITYFENIGTRTAPVYSEGVIVKIENGTDFKMEVYYNTATSFDWNCDGKMDLMIGDENGRICYLEGTGNFAENGAPIFKESRFFKMPGQNLKVGAFATPYSIDWDGDGDEDLFVGEASGFVTFIENITPADGDKGNPVWAAPVRLTDENGDVIRVVAGYNGSVQGPAEQLLGYTVPSMGDWDGDGDIDIVLNNIYGKIQWMENLNAPGEHDLKFSGFKTIQVNTDTPEKPVWNWWEPKPYELVTQWRTTPYVIDLNKDGLNDLVMLDCEGYLSFYEKMENGMVKVPQRIFYDENGSLLQLQTAQNGSSGRLKFVLVDWDQDGKLDIVHHDGISVSWRKNVGTCENPWMFATRVNLHTRQLTKHSPSPAVCDWNTDGIPDLVVGAEDGHFYYLINKNATEVYVPRDCYDIVYANNKLFITQYGVEQENVCAIIAWYDANQKLERTEIFNNITLEDGVKKTVNVNKTGNAGESIKIFVWNNMEEIKPKCNVVTGSVGSTISKLAIDKI